MESLAKHAGYSKYHLHRMFAGVVGLTVHSYVVRRRLTEAARSLVFTKKPVMEIALLAGYDTQQSFTAAFKSVFMASPQAFRNNGEFHPLQLKYTVDGITQLRGDKAVDIRSVESKKMLLAGYVCNTLTGFSVIGECMGKFISNHKMICNPVEKHCIIGLNDYTAYFFREDEQPVFDFYAAIEVESLSSIPEGMAVKELPATRYVVFSFTGKPQDSLQPVADYIYKEWFPQSTCKFNDNNMYDFSKSYTATDSNGNSRIEYWIPIL